MLSAMSGQENAQGIDVKKDITRYNELHDDSKVDAAGRNSAYAELVNSYYNLATDFYEWVSRVLCEEKVWCRSAEAQSISSAESERWAIPTWYCITGIHCDRIQYVASK